MAAQAARVGRRRASLGVASQQPTRESTQPERARLQRTLIPVAVRLGPAENHAAPRCKGSGRQGVDELALILGLVRGDGEIVGVERADIEVHDDGLRPRDILCLARRSGVRRGAVELGQRDVLFVGGQDEDVSPSAGGLGDPPKMISTRDYGGMVLVG